MQDNESTGPHKILADLHIHGLCVPEWGEPSRCGCLPDGEFGSVLKSSQRLKARGEGCGRRRSRVRGGHCSTLDRIPGNCAVWRGVVFDSHVRVWDDRRVTSDNSPQALDVDEHGASGEHGTSGEHGRSALASDHPLNDGRTTHSPLILAAEGRPVPHTPVWFMRQAGRSLPEYRQLREGRTMLETCFNPDLTVEITLQPVRRHGVDAAILFSDIVVPIRAIGIDVEIAPGIGPVIAEPFRTASDVDRLRDLEPDDVAPVIAAVSALVERLGSTPLIGFAGAPFTVASYLVEGRPSRDHVHTKALMLSDPTTWNRLLDRIATICGDFLSLQIQAGASAVQLFDSWAGALSARDYERAVLPHSRKVFAAVAPYETPRIHFGVGTSELLPLMQSAGANVMGVDFRLPLSEAIKRLNHPIALQGNLDPAVLFAEWPAVSEGVMRVLGDAQGLPGHIFNLGHGVPPDTDPDVLTRVVDLVHRESTR